MALDTQGLSWQMAPASQATAAVRQRRHRRSRISTLVSGDQQISADGTFGRPGDALKVTMTNVDLAAVDALLLRPPQVDGRLDATGTLQGTKQALQGNADFQVSKGSVPGVSVRHIRRHGRLQRDQGLTVDARLQQNATQWITAKGYVPRALFSPRASPLITPAADHDAVVAPEDRVDLTIDSSPIDLGRDSGLQRRRHRRQGNARGPPSRDRSGRRSASDRRDYGP